MVTVDIHLHVSLIPEHVPKWWTEELYRPFGGEIVSTDGRSIVELLAKSASYER